MKSFDFFSLDYIYFPVSGIMWVWHKIFGSVLGANNGWAWVLAVVFLVFTLRSLLFKPFMGQMNSQMKMQAVAPEMKRIREKYKDDKPRLAEELQKFQKEAGVNPLSGCLPALVQAPVFIGLFHVLRSFIPGHQENYFFGAADVKSFVDSKLFGGAPLSAYMTQPWQTTVTNGVTKVGLGPDGLDGVRSTVIAVGIPLTILAGIATFLTSRRSVARQQQMQGPGNDAMPQAALMNKLMKYVFPLFVVIGGPFFPLAILFYWLSNNSWTFGQLYVAHRIQDKKIAAQSMVVEEARAASTYTKPAPGARPANKPAPGARPSPGAKPSAGQKSSGPRTGTPARPLTPGGRPATSGEPYNGQPRGGAGKRRVVQPSAKADTAAAGESITSSASSGSSNGKSTGPNGSSPSLKKTGGVSNGSTPTSSNGSSASSGSNGAKPTTGTRQTTAKKKKPGQR